MNRPASTRLHAAPTLVAALVCALLLSGCGGGAKTGRDDILKTTGPVNTCGILGCATTTPKATSTKATSAPRTPTATPRKTTAPPRKTTPPPAAKPFTISIYGDKSGKPLIDPPQAAVYVGTTVVWRNADTKVHGVQAQDGSFNSGDIRPGGSYSWIARTPGNHAYQDTKRPYVNASIQVAPR